MRRYLPFSTVRQSPEFLSYYQAAERFCFFLEQDSCLATTDFLVAVRSQLLQLYADASAMPWLDLQSNKEYEEKLSVVAYQTLLSTVARQLGEARYYWHMFDPTDSDDTAPVCGDLLDDLGDIYKDLKYSLVVYHLGEVDCEENALWQLKFDFDAHWDAHCINALSAIHFYLKKL